MTEFDIYPELDELEATLDDGQEAQADGLKTVVDESMDAQQAEEAAEVENKNAEVLLEWAKNELRGVFPLWQRYSDVLGNVPRSVEDLQKTNPNLIPTLQRLFDGFNHLNTSGEKGPNGESLSQTMRLVLVPWEAFQKPFVDMWQNKPDDFDFDKNKDFIEWLRSMRLKQELPPDKVDYEINLALTTGGNLYIDQSVPMPPDLRLQDPVNISEYLSQKRDQDGPWGVILTQTSEKPGLLEYDGLNPVTTVPDIDGVAFDDLTDGGRQHWTINGLPVDAMGILEWLALTFQKPGELDDTLLMANVNPGVWKDRIVGGRSIGFLRSGRYELNAVASDKSQYARPRVTVA